MNIKPEDIKWILENFEVEGFMGVVNMSGRSAIIHNLYKDRECTIYINGNTFRDIYLPLFLQRVIEGINNNDEGIFLIDQGRYFIDIYTTNESTTYDKRIDYSKGEEDQAKEKAIMYIVDLMIGVNNV